MIFKQKLETKNKTKGINTCEYIILHHTGTKEGTIQGILNAFTGSKKVSAHYVVDTNGDIYKIGKDSEILWHAGTSEWNGKRNLNKYSIGIEVIGPLSNFGFTDKQKISVENLLIYLIKTHGIKKENVLRHKDITDRKWDISDTFWNDKFKTFQDYKNNLFSKIEIMGFYEKMFKEKYGKGTVFNDIDGAVEKCIDEKGSIRGKEFFYLCMIGLERIKKDQ